MPQYSINYMLAMEKSLRERLNQLTTLRDTVANMRYYEGARRDEPQYDVKKVDAKITRINQALFQLNHKIKEANAKTLIEVDTSYDELVSPIE